MFHIIFSADENYIKYTAVLISSIIQNTNTKHSFQNICNNCKFEAPKHSSFSSYVGVDFWHLSNKERNEGYLFHILSDKISIATQDKLKALENQLNQIYPCSILTHIIDDSKFSSFPLSGAAHTNLLPYYRLKLDEYLDPSVTKCLYLDSDMLCLCDLRELFAIDLKDNILAAINDPGTKKRKIKFKENSKIITHKFTNDYFNSGFLLFNTKAYREYQIEQKCQAIAQNATYIKAADQDLLNATIPQDKLLKLPIAYNFSSISFCFAICKDEQRHRLNCTRAEFMQSYKHPKIIHYGEKPWKFLQSYTDSKGRNINTIWWDYAQNTPEFSTELLTAKAKIQGHLELASLGFAVLQFSNNPLRYFRLHSLIQNPKNHPQGQVPQEIFGLCCLLGEIIIHAKTHHKGVLSTLLKAWKIQRNFKRFNTQQFNN